MKTMTTVLTSLLSFVLSLSACVESGVPIQFERLPESARSMLNKNFPGAVPLVIKAEGNEYEVVFTSGESVEFDRKGNWKEVNCPNNSVPADIVPAEILNKINDIYPGVLVIKIERDRHGYDIRLNNTVELEFNRRYILCDADVND